MKRELFESLQPLKVRFPTGNNRLSTALSCRICEAPVAFIRLPVVCCPASLPSLHLWTLLHRLSELFAPFCCTYVHPTTSQHRIQSRLRRKLCDGSPRLRSSHLCRTFARSRQQAIKRFLVMSRVVLLVPEISLPVLSASVWSASSFCFVLNLSRAAFYRW